MPKLLLERGRDGSIAGLISLVPEFELKKQPSELVFLTDCSGSMMGESIGLAREALLFFVQSLPVDSYSNILSFVSTYRRLFKKRQSLFDKSLSLAKKNIKNLEADWWWREQQNVW